MNYHWNYKETSKDVVENIQSKFNLPKPIAVIMAQRGIKNKKNFNQYCDISINSLHDPFLMLNMKKSVEFIKTMIEKKETIVILGDFDVDGITATPILFLFFKSLNVDVYYYIPNRFTEGHGISKNGIDFSSKIGAKLIITCDCGISAFEEIKYANTKNLHTIITDHHNQKQKLPEAYSIINPKQNSCNYPFKGLSGSGVALKLALGICKSMGLDSSLALQYTDIVTLGIISDAVPIIDENRAIITDGLSKIKKEKNIGITALLNQCKISKNRITIDQLLYSIIPKINSAGKVGDAARGVKLITSRNFILAKNIAADLNNENIKRQSITLSVFNDCISKIKNDNSINERKAIILSSNSWHDGVLGIVASKIKEKYHKPSIIINFKKNGIGTASCRSILGFNIYNAIEICSKHLISYGGHAMATGFTIDSKNLKLFCAQFYTLTEKLINKQKLKPKIYIDTKLNMIDINSRLLKFLRFLSPFGPGNENPVFLARNIKVIGIPQIIGKNNDVIKFIISGEKVMYEVTGLNMIEKYEYLISGKKIDIVYEIKDNNLKTKSSIQLNLKDIKTRDNIYA